MKKLNQLLFFGILLFWIQPVIAQKNIKVEYQIKAKQSLKRPAITEPFLLFVDKNSKSLFISKNKLIAKEILKEYWKKLQTKDPYNISMSATDPAVVKANQYQNNYKVIIEKDYKSQKYKYQQRAFMSVLQYQAKLPELKWQLQDSTKTILGYTVYKAGLNYKGRHYTAWYAPAIAVSDGPYKFGGLPGLILEIYDDKDDYHFTATGIEFPEKMNFPEKYFSKGSNLMPVIQTTEQNFQKDFDKTFNPESITGTTVYIGKNSEEMKAERVEKIKSLFNNPIELTND